ncbi:hypothetical protein S83_011830 [Arachis hypogaea]
MCFYSHRALLRHVRSSARAILKHSLCSAVVSFTSSQVSQIGTRSKQCMLMEISLKVVHKAKLHIAHL